MSNTKEIITLQFGNFANYVGTHYWNIQEHSFNYDPDSTETSEINHDVLFREGKHNKNVTFTPRMLLVDLKGSLKYVPEGGNLYTSNTLELNNPENRVLDQVKGTFEWDDEEKIEVMESEKIPMPSYQKALMETGLGDSQGFNLKDTISNWPDFMYTRYHPRSINVIKKFEYHEDTSTLDTFTAGRLLWSDSIFEDDYCDKIRNYIEECDNCQGFQTFFDAADGFAGLTIKSMEYLQDDFGKAILAIPLIPPKAKRFPFADDAMSDSIRVVNLAYSYAKLYEHSSLIVPLSTMERGWRQIGEPRSFNYLNYEPENYYHSSSIIATFLDTMSVKYRLKEGQSYLSNFCAELNIYNRKLCGAKLSLPFPMNEKEDLIDFLDKYEGELFQSLSPGTNIGTDRIVQSISLRGIPKSRLKRPLEKAKDQMKLPAYKCGSISEMLQLYYQCNLYSSLSNVTAIESPMKIQSPFPHEIFDSRLNFNGFVREFVNDQASKSQVMEMPVMTAVQNSSEIFNTLDSLHSQVARIKIAKIPRFVDSNLEAEEFKELLEELLLFKEQYEDNSFL